MPYHHDDLRGQFLTAAAAAIASDGLDRLNLRALARDLGVTHAAARHHFGGKRGLVTALAVEGHAVLDQALRAAPSLIAAGIAYVTFAVQQPAHFQVMFQPTVVDADNPDLARAKRSLGEALAAAAGRPAGSAPPDDPELLAAWSLAHGLATLAIGGNLPDLSDETGRTLLRATLGRLSSEPTP